MSAPLRSARDLARGVPVTAWLRAAVLAGAAAVCAWPLSIGVGVAAAALGAAAGSLVADRANRVRRSGGSAAAQLRSGAALSLAALGAGLALLGAGLLVSSAPLASWVGPIAAFGAGEALRWGLLAGPLVFALRLLAGRSTAAAVLELLVVAAAFAAGFAAHRGGMVHRPLAIGDWAWSRGIDPAVAFLALGGVFTLLLAGMLLAEVRARQLPLHLGALLLVAIAILALVRITGLPAPRAPSDLGLTGEPRESRRSAGTAGDASRDELSELRFRDEYSDSGGEGPVAVVVLHGDYEPPGGIFYFRQAVFSHFNGRRLVQSFRGDVDQDVLGHFPARARDLTHLPPGLESREKLRSSVGLLVEHVKPFALDAPVRFEPAPNPDALRFQRTYRVTSRVPTLPLPALLGSRPRFRDWWRHYTEGPDDPRYAELAREIAAALREEHREDPLALALSVKAWLESRGIYSRRSSHAGAGDPTASFLFGDLTGYCVHFAHAATFLLRSLELPARVATGYAVPAGDRAGGSALMIRGVNAHAWPEVFLEGVGWVVVDPAPQRSLDPAPAQPDPELQRMLGEMLRDQLDERRYAEAFFRSTPSLRELARAGLLAGLLACALCFGVKLYRRLAPALAGPAQLARVGYRAALDRLAEVGLRRGFGESRERFAARLAATTPSFGALTSLHLRAALGPAGPDAAPRALLRSTSRELRRQVPAWRRAIGWLDPFSWLRAR